MTETVKERIYREALEIMSDSDFMGNEYAKKFVKGVFKQIEDIPVATDKLSAEKLQEQLNTAKKALTEIAGGHTVEDAIFNHQLIASEALAAIGGDDE